MKNFQLFECLRIWMYSLPKTSKWFWNISEDCSCIVCIKIGRIMEITTRNKRLNYLHGIAVKMWKKNSHFYISKKIYNWCGFSTKVLVSLGIPYRVDLWRCPLKCFIFKTFTRLIIFSFWKLKKISEDLTWGKKGFTPLFWIQLVLVLVEKI